MTQLVVIQCIMCKGKRESEDYDDYECLLFKIKELKVGYPTRQPESADNICFKV